MKKIFTLFTLLMFMCLQGFAQNYVQQWGRLKLVGNQLSSESGEPVQLRGWSTHGKQWHGGCFDDKGDFERMKQNGANLARIAMYITEGGGVDMNWIKNCVNWTEELGMYCLVDWHILTPGNPNSGEYSGAENFFRELSQWVGQSGKKNVLYEICNEPNKDEEGDPYQVGADVWPWVKKYAKKILPVIEQNDKGAVVIVGTPQWDKALSYPLEDPIDDYDLNVMYSFHHYTCDQQFFLGIMSGAAASLPIFVTEWGTSKDDGGANGQICLDDAENMLKVCNGKNLGNQIISWANWSWSDNNRSSSSFTSYPNSWSQSGNFIKQHVGRDNFSFAKSTPYEGGHTFDGVNDLELALEKYDKGGHHEAYYDMDREDWWHCKACNAGDLGDEGYRPGEYVDLGYTSKADKDSHQKNEGYINLGYIVNGEWVKYTIDVKIPGDYEFETYVCNHKDDNIVAISVDGKNALVGEDGKEKYKAFKMQTSGSGVSDGGYDDWGWKSPKCEADGNYKFRIRFEKAGEQVLGLAFLTSNSGLGSLKLLGKPENADPNSVVDFAGDQAPVIYPNPAENGSFNVSVAEASVVKVFSAQGAEILSQEVAAGKTAISLGAGSGIYVVSISNNSGVVTEKLVVK